jgi:hypothetical protein
MYAVKNQINHTTCHLPPVFTLVSGSSYSSALKKESICSFGTYVDFQRTTLRYMPDGILHNHRCENLKSHMITSRSELRLSHLRTLSHIWVWLLDGGLFGLHLLTPLGTTSSFSAISALHILQFTTAPAKPFTNCCVLTSHSLATAPNSGDCSASHV